MRTVLRYEHELRAAVVAADDPLENQLLEQIAVWEKRADAEKRRKRLHDFPPLPTQKRYLEAVNDPEKHLVLMYGPNGCGKSKVAGADLSAEMLGYEPWSGRPRPMRSDIPYHIALLLPDYDNHARKFLDQDISPFHRTDDIKVDRTHEGAPRRIRVKDPRTGCDARHAITIYTSKQDVLAGEAPNIQRLHIDEPCSHAHYLALSRGLRGTGGKVTITATLKYEPWMVEEILDRCGNHGGEKHSWVALKADWRENVKEYGGHVPLKDFEEFWSKCSPELLACVKGGHPIWITGRVFPEFDPTYHVRLEDPVPEDIVRTCPRILCVDPHPRRPFFMLWLYVTPAEGFVVYDEWPTENFASLKQSSLDYDDYARIIWDHGPTHLQLCDPKMGDAPAAAGDVTVAEKLSTACGRYFTTEIAVDVTDGILELHRRLGQRGDWDPLGENRRDDEFFNIPDLIIKPNCRNVIQALRSNSWQDPPQDSKLLKGPSPKQQERWKDPIDCLRWPCVHPGATYWDVTQLSPQMSKLKPRRSEPHGQERLGRAVDQRHRPLTISRGA